VDRDVVVRVDCKGCHGCFLFDCLYLAVVTLITPVGDKGSGFDWVLRESFQIEEAGAGVAGRA